MLLREWKCKLEWEKIFVLYKEQEFVDPEYIKNPSKSIRKKADKQPNRKLVKYIIKEDNQRHIKSVFNFMNCQGNKH